MTTSGWCPPWPHPTDHARYEERITRGEVTCACEEHGGHESPSPLEESRSRGQGNRGAREILRAQEKTAPRARSANCERIPQGLADADRSDD